MASEDPLEASLVRELKTLIHRLAEAEAAVEVLLSGQADAIIDPVQGAAILLRRAQNALRESEQRYRGLAYHDPLTGLANRLLLDMQLERVLQRARRNKLHIALLFVDLDHFKVVNDTLGHACGDELLRTVADRLKKTVRAVDMVARVGGDEFIVVLDEISHLGDAALLARKLLSVLNEPICLNHQQVIPVASIGIAVYPEDAQDGEGLMRVADSAMYQEKSSGRHGYRFADPGSAREASRQQVLADSLAAPLDFRQFVLYFQPVCSIATGTPVATQALLHWRHPQLGLLRPEMFLDALEQHHLVAPLTSWMLDTVAARLSLWRDQGKLPQRICIQLSASQLEAPDLFASLAALLGNAWVPSLELELDEEDLPSLHPHLQAVTALKPRGLSVAVDRFGRTGFPLMQLAQLPVDALMLDSALVAGIGLRTDVEATIHALIAFGHGLGLRLVARGVETPEQLAFLQREQCDEAHGRLFGEPALDQG